MTPERHQRIGDLFHKARQRPLQARSKFLKLNCDDDELRIEVERLLACDDSPVAELDSGAQLGAAALEALQGAAAPSDAQGSSTTSQDAVAIAPRLSRVGNYSVQRVIASGGMGTVYEAVQENPRRVVALKLMRAGIASPAALRRFEYESQVLARLRHPNIAHVLEAGTHRDGDINVPFFAMEYIPSARPITKYAGDQRLDTRERMSLFADVCDAVHHGHQKGVIHRDLKPGNILVDAAGRVKIIDFGVARATDSDLAVTTLQTDVGQLIGTLQYMSPEQCEADPHNIDVRSDVYALGVVFFELLTEQLPYDLSTKALSDATRVIREQPPTKPSAVNRRLHGDVETIALKALEKERDRRYQSALEFQQDIRRFLNAEAITARPPSVHYQLRVFARRHKAVTTSVATIMAILIGATAVSTFSLVRARRAEESALIEAGRARREAARSAEIARFTTDMLDGVKPSVALGRDTTMLREILDATAQRVGKELAHEPELEATIRVTLGNTYRDLGLLEPAKENLAQAAATFSRALGAQDPRALHAANSLAIVIQNQGHFDEAEGAVRGTIEIQRRVQGEQHPNTMASINTLANSLFSQGRYAEAEELFRTNLEVQRETLGVEHRDTLGTMNNLANTLRSLGRKTEAMDLVNESLEIRSKKLGAEHPDTLMSMSSVAIGLYNDGYFAEAGALFRKVVESQERVLGQEHPTTLSSMMNLGGCLANQGYYAEAEVVFRKSWEAQRRVLGEEHASSLLMANSLANSLRDQGRYAEAEELYHQTLDSQRRVLREGHPETILSMENLANCLSNQGRYDEAEVVLREAIAIQRAKGAAPSAGTLHGLSAVLVKLERWTEAEPLCREARSIWVSELPTGHRALELNANLLGAILCGLGRYAEAEPLLVESYEKLREDPGVREDRKKELLHRIVRLYDLWNVAEPDIRRAQEAAVYRAQESPPEMPAENSANH